MLPPGILISLIDIIQDRIYLCKPYPLSSLITIGGLLVLFGVCAALSMVLRPWLSLVPLEFFAYGASVVGMFIGLIGMTQYRQRDER